MRLFLVGNNVKIELYLSCLFSSTYLCLPFKLKTWRNYRQNIPTIAKIKSFLSLGSKVGILLNPEQHTIEIYRPEQEVVRLDDGDVLEVPDLLPGWKVAVTDLWPPEF
ncbi:MAG: hypothetical protein F6K58_12650 [Symploca sp. SIO2E9]|nr:hypothetical protein [Symploca sp. SIO2E9]